MKCNRSKTYILPLLSELIQLNPNYNDKITNTYIFDDVDKYNDCIYLLHKTNFRDADFTLYENKLLHNDFFVDLKDVNKETSLYIFSFPNEYLHEYNMFKQGKYSHFGEDAKELILQYWGMVYQNKPSGVNFLLKLKQVLNRDPKLRRQIEQQINSKISESAELADRIEPIEETFQLSTLLYESSNKTGANL